MTIAFQIGRYRARIGTDPADLEACQRLRHLCFFGTEGRDHDRFDRHSRHLMVEDAARRLVCAARIMHIARPDDLARSYTAQFYDLAGMAGRCGPLLELGRFCIAPDVQDADVVRVAWGALARIVDQQEVQTLCGCTSFAGTDPDLYALAFARLATRHQGPAALRPAVTAPEAVRLGTQSGDGAAPMPSLLRSYLAMGGWVGEHAVVDRQMNTLHVFTCLDIAAVPPARARALRAITGQPAR
jgi:L-ornithine Nalpha-acyltransferase